MEIIKIGEKRWLTWGFHELAFSLRTSGVEQVFFDEFGRKVGSFLSQKRAGRARIPPDAKYFLRRYWTNKGYPRHTLYEIRDDELVYCYSIDSATTPADILSFDIPEKLKEWLIEDIWG